MRFEVFTALRIQIKVFWVVMPCDTSVSEDLAACFFRVKTEAARSSKTLVSYCNTTTSQPRRLEFQKHDSSATESL